MKFRWLVVVLALMGTIGTAPAAHAQIGGWVSANAIAAVPPDRTTTQETVGASRGETAKVTFAYPAKTKASFDIGGGVRLAGGLGVGVAFSRYQDNEQANLSATFPSPFRFNNPSTDSKSSTDALTNDETVVHIEARYVANLPHASFAVFAGPSYFKGRREVISDFTFFESTDSRLPYSITLNGETKRQAVDFAVWGANVGADVGYFFTENVGVGVLARFSRGKVDLPNVFGAAFSHLTTPSTQTVNVGGLNVGGGLRIRF